MLDIAFSKYCDAQTLDQELQAAGLVRDVKFFGVTSYANCPGEPECSKTTVHAADDILGEDFSLIEATVIAHVPPGGEE